MAIKTTKMYISIISFYVWYNHMNELVSNNTMLFLCYRRVPCPGFVFGSDKNDMSSNRISYCWLNQRLQRSLIQISLWIRSTRVSPWILHSTLPPSWSIIQCHHGLSRERWEPSRHRFRHHSGYPLCSSGALWIPRLPDICFSVWWFSWLHFTSKWTLFKGKDTSFQKWAWKCSTFLIFYALTTPGS